MEKLDNLTGVRAFAALWVVVFHFRLGDGMSAIGGPILDSGYIGVDVFFVLSGFILSHAYCKNLPLNFSLSWYREFIVKRFAKIYPLHLVMFLTILSVVVGARYMGYAFQNTLENTVWSAIANLLLMHAWGVTSSLSWNVPSWSISAEWFAYFLVFPLAAFCLRKMSLSRLSFLCGVLWSAYFYGAMHWNDQSLNVTTAGVARIIPEFLIGYTAYQALQREKFAAVSGDFLSISGIALLLFSIVMGGAFLILVAPAIGIAMTGLYIGGSVSNVVFGNRMVVSIGTVSYSIYMTHFFIVMGANQFIRRVHFLNVEKHAAAFLLFEVVIAVAIGLVTHRFVEEPLRLRVLAIAKRRRAGTSAIAGATTGA
ncbi:acyltransferase family protein [Paraburkholderia caffeinilytica]|uniref:acyltransferase family protein n=1 Tax=Paraburkholderia caffeinilytica TaxID=1761016 RepID=UPI0038B6FA7E